MGKKSKKALKVSVTIQLKKMDRVFLGLILCGSLVSDKGSSSGMLLTGSITEESQICGSKLSTTDRTINE